jgi:DNA-binding response OmpR family regulator
MVEKNDYTLVLMDYQMPVMDGMAATKAIRGMQGPKSKVAIIALTASAMIGDREHCLAGGMDDYLDKPIDRARLVELLDRWAERLADAPDPAPVPPPPAAPPVVEASGPKPLLDREVQGRIKAEDLRRRVEAFRRAITVAGGDPGKLAALRSVAIELGFIRLAEMLGAEEIAPAVEIGSVAQRSIEATILLLDA